MSLKETRTGTDTAWLPVERCDERADMCDPVGSRAESMLSERLVGGSG